MFCTFVLLIRSRKKTFSGNLRQNFVKNFRLRISALSMSDSAKSEHAKIVFECEGTRYVFEKRTVELSIKGDHVKIGRSQGRVECFSISYSCIQGL